MYYLFRWEHLQHVLQKITWMWGNLWRSPPTPGASVLWSPWTWYEWGRPPLVSPQSERSRAEAGLLVSYCPLEDNNQIISNIRLDPLKSEFSVSPLLLSLSCSDTLSHMEALKPLAMWGQQFCPTKGKWRGAACQGEEEKWLGRHSPSPSPRPGDSFPFQSRPTLFPPAEPFCLKLADAPPGVEAPSTTGKVSRCRGSIFMLASTICCMPFSKTSWQPRKEHEVRKTHLFLNN